MLRSDSGGNPLSSMTDSKERARLANSRAILSGKIWNQVAILSLARKCERTRPHSGSRPIAGRQGGCWGSIESPFGLESWIQYISGSNRWHAKRLIPGVAHPVCGPPEIRRDCPTAPVYQ